MRTDMFNLPTCSFRISIRQQVCVYSDDFTSVFVLITASISPSAGFSRLSVPPKNVVINVSRDVEIDRDEGDSRIGRII